MREEDRVAGVVAVLIMDDAYECFVVTMCFVEEGNMMI